MTKSASDEFPQCNATRLRPWFGAARQSSLRCLLLVAVMVLCALPVAIAQPSADPLRDGFRNPPQSARPRVWWHWLNGNITKQGIQLDLEWMQRIGLGGFQNFDATMMTPQVVEHRLVYMTPEWKDAFRFAMTTADRLGLEASIAGSPGWSESGGPWVKPAQAMKKYVWTETRIAGGQPYHGKLAAPSSVAGPFQNKPFRDFLAAVQSRPEGPPPAYYADAVVFAYRAPESDVPMARLQPRVSSSAGAIDAERLWDGDVETPILLPKGKPGEQSWIQFDFGKPQTVRGLTLAMSETVSPFADFASAPSGRELQASDDGVAFRTVANIPGTSAPQLTLSFAAVTARYFRVVFTHLPEVNPFGEGVDLAELGLSFAPPAKDFPVAELVLHTGARVTHWEDKAAFATATTLYPFVTPEVDAALAVRKNDVLDLTAKMHPDGTLDWTPPPGTWTVVRLGYSLTGVTNHPASPEGTGLEVDKLSAEHVRAYLTKYLDMYNDASGGLMGRRGLQGMINDSYEAGSANWTDGLLAEFARRRGYSALPWLPVLTGVVVESAASSDGFLWDFRKTLGELIAENHYGQINTLLHERGMKHYGESHESGRVFVGDGMDAKRGNDVPMGAMWTQMPGQNAEQFGYNADLRESASVAHIYGQNIAAGESFTAALGPWAWSPETLKPTADKELAMGLNRFVIHTSVHQPLTDRAPGLGLGPIGQWFTRNETWAEPARAWVDYLARSSYLLQQGRFAADVLYFYGEDSNITALFKNSAPQIPAGYNFDYLNASALASEVAVSKGRLVTRSGLEYRLLALDPFSRHMSLPVLRQLRRLVEQGAVIAGLKPESTPSLADDPAEFRKIAGELWGSGEAHRVGKGAVYSTTDLSAVLKDLQVAPDFASDAKPAELAFVHRRLADGDIYWIDNATDRKLDAEVSLRTTGREAEVWHADTGAAEPASYRITGARTVVPLQLAPREAVFVVLRRHSSALSRTLPAAQESLLATLDGPWQIAFPPGRGAPERATFAVLSSWSANDDAGIKYFSGTATYAHALQVPPEWLAKDAHVWLDLGEVKNLAEVRVNGQQLGTLWKPPFRVELTPALKSGENRVEIAVTNLWVNRIIGDRQPDAVKKYTSTVPERYKAKSPLLPSGLLGPVRLLSITQ